MACSTCWTPCEACKRAREALSTDPKFDPDTCKKFGDIKPPWLCAWFARRSVKVIVTAELIRVFMQKGSKNMWQTMRLATGTEGVRALEFLRCSPFETIIGTTTHGAPDILPWCLPLQFRVDVIWVPLGSRWGWCSGCRMTMLVGGSAGNWELGFQCLRSVWGR